MEDEMKKVFLTLALTSLTGGLLHTLTASACDSKGITGIVAENSMYIPANMKTLGGITEDTFNVVMDRMVKIYAPIIAAKGKTLFIERNWEDGTVNAYASQSGNTWKVAMFGGLARHEVITADGFALVVCHELGHHLGGLPKKRELFGSTWASNEGQADYFGTMKCLRKFMETENNIEMVKNMDIDPVASAKCNASFSAPKDIAMCERGAMAGMSLGNLFKALRQSPTQLKFDTPDPSVVNKTNDSHPDSQCRLDTYFAGSLCDKNHYDDVSNSNPNTNVCALIDGYNFGTRPLCWYKP
jgi:hypothetical protein